MTPWIVDASLALTWYLDDEVNRAYGLSVLEALSERELRVPALFVYEMSSALVMAYRRNRISREELTEILAKLASFNFAVEDTTPDLFFHACGIGFGTRSHLLRCCLPGTGDADRSSDSNAGQSASCGNGD